MQRWPHSAWSHELGFWVEEGEKGEGRRTLLSCGGAVRISAPVAVKIGKLDGLG
ncbi:hypothetical protein ABER99_03765 [Paenibacillus glucanolyticus]|uniref:hypothetical protein n=1 Tax=Paenibacillus glucanolyticus TaxID=59843 RepID=UPI0012DDEB38|nr:hypothetical protein [Paenibacillus glucanolyticus]